MSLYLRCNRLHPVPSRLRRMLITSEKKVSTVANLYYICTIKLKTTMTNQLTTTAEDQIVDHIAELISEDMPTQSIREVVFETYSIIGEKFTELFSKAFTK